MPTTFFISDLHLSSNQPTLTRLFFYFLQHWAPQAEALYILGDLFEIWIGDEEKTPLSKQVQQSLHQLTQQGLKIYFMPGNRDFLVGKTFLNEAGCQYLADPNQIDLYGVPTLLTHGDQLCTQDKLYQRFRSMVRSPLTQRLFLALPLSTRRRIATYLRDSSTSSALEHDFTDQHTPSVKQDKFDVVLTEVLTSLEQNKAQVLIHGHTHQPAIQLLRRSATKPSQAPSTDSNESLSPANHSFKKRFVLSDWRADQGNVLVVTPKESKLIYFP
ncbi:UDP-2,3-diacylglucosamine diphosphatase [Rickettsiella massiliensis]|uniref:UDP-2,3-diacylglucosamine diphosphatase n=1 Tax=Rickettsiella massiliensis TaxID=676517 RepID=UPI0002D6A8A1|nr:UDP-2,3-diacylglucosamine diphosphatase [Rickettsiella massiliensis]